MFTFVIWAIGLIILWNVAMFNLEMLALAFEANWLAGIFVLALSGVGWFALLVAVL